MNIALIRNKIVQNIVVFETLPDAISMLPLLDVDEAVEASVNCNIGYTYDNGVFTPPEVKPSEMEIKVQELEAKIRALTDQNEFLEECLVEMAAIVYA